MEVERDPRSLGPMPESSSSSPLLFNHLEVLSIDGQKFVLHRPCVEFSLAACKQQQVPWLADHLVPIVHAFNQCDGSLQLLRGNLANSQLVDLMHLLQYLDYKGPAYHRGWGNDGHYFRSSGDRQTIKGGLNQLKLEVKDRWCRAFSEHDTEALSLFVLSNAVGVDHPFRPPGSWVHKSSGLVQAAQHGDDNMTQTLLKLGANYNALDHSPGLPDITPLITALQYGHENVALVLLEAGADPTIGVPTELVWGYPKTLLGLAWNTTKSPHLIRELLQHGADPNAISTATWGEGDTDGPDDFPVELTDLVAKEEAAARALALQYQKIPSDLMRIIKEYEWRTPLSR